MCQQVCQKVGKKKKTVQEQNIADFFLISANAPFQGGHTKSPELLAGWDAHSGRRIPSCKGKLRQPPGLNPGSKQNQGWGGEKKEPPPSLPFTYHVAGRLRSRRQLVQRPPARGSMRLRATIALWEQRRELSQSQDTGGGFSGSDSR